MNGLVVLACLLYYSTRTFTLAIHTHAPDFSRYVSPPTATLSAHQFPLDDPRRRTIIVGDIHGMYDTLIALLAQIRYEPSSDVLIHVGDIAVKAPKTRSSLAVLHFLASRNITGVRGNHDQHLIEWRSWIVWVESHPSGKKWLADLHARRKAAVSPTDPEEEEEELNEREIKRWVDRDRERHGSEWWAKIPKGWKILSKHYNVAHRMSSSDYEYLLQLPVTLHVPSAHAFILHAGLLPSDPKRDPTHASQPLTRVPGKGDGSEHEELLREMQETSVLRDVPPNRDPWTLLNIRSLRHNSVSRKQHGTPWSEVWNEQIDRCVGFFPSSELDSSSSQALLEGGQTAPFRCLPMTVVYGHAASRGLDVKRHSIGIDSGCVYGNQLTALVLGPAPGESTAMGRRIEFGDGYIGRLVSVECS